jgi:hypothetical protein
MKNNIPKNTLVYYYIANEITNRCFWCGQMVRECGTCKGGGKYRGENCPACNGNGKMCPTHEGDWPKN